MKARVRKCGKSLAVCLPAAAVRKAGLKEGDFVEVESRSEGEIELRGPTGVPSLKRLVAQIRPGNRYKEISSGKQVGREVIE